MHRTPGGGSRHQMGGQTGQGTSVGQAGQAIQTDQADQSSGMHQNNQQGQLEYANQGGQGSPALNVAGLSHRSPSQRNASQQSIHIKLEQQLQQQQQQRHELQAKAQAQLLQSPQSSSSLSRPMAMTFTPIQSEFRMVHVNGTPNLAPAPTAGTGAPTQYSPHAKIQHFSPQIYVPSPRQVTASPQASFTNSELYTATYSGIPVFELMVGGVAVMRRRQDSWLNATQILKVAGVDKSKRTKILEKEILTDVYEKVQGGYGKYQGTWIPFERGVSLCNQYSVYDVLEPLLQFDANNAGMENTPTKEQAMAAKRKRDAANPTIQVISGSGGHASYAQPLQVTGSGGSFVTTPLANNATSALTALSRVSRMDSDPGLSGPRGVSRQAARFQSLPTHNEQHEPAEESAPKRAKHNPSASIGSVGSYMDTTPIDSNTITTANTQTDPPTSFHDSHGIGAPSADGLNSHPPSPSPPLLEPSNIPLPPLDAASTPDFEASKEILTHIFLEDNNTNLGLEMLNANNIDVPIDDLGHTALHWACALARIPLVKELIRYGANRRRANYVGETALVRAVLVTNNSDNSTFPELLDILYPAITLVDNHGRTVLHHIALTAGIKGRSDASRYYLECLLQWIVKRGSQSKSGRVGLGRFMTEVVNTQDKNGDTSLNIAARVGNKNIAQQLLEVGADPTIPNRAGLRPIDFGISQEDNSPSNRNHSTQHGHNLPHLPLHQHSASSAALVAASASRTAAAHDSLTTAEKRKEIVKNLSGIVEKLEDDFDQELQGKQTLIDTMHSRLREATVNLTDRKQKLERLKSLSNKVVEWQRRSQNLERAVNEEDRNFTAEEVRQGRSSSALPLGFEGNFDADQPFRVWSVAQAASSTVDSQQHNLHEYSDIPPTILLRARITAYKRNKEKLQQFASELRSRSTELEQKYRKVVALCIGVEESKVDSLLEGMLRVIESESA